MYKAQCASSKVIVSNDVEMARLTLKSHSKTRGGKNTKSTTYGVQSVQTAQNSITKPYSIGTTKEVPPQNGQ